MIGARTLGRHQQENDVDRTLVDRIEIDGMDDAREQPDRLVEICETTVWNGDAAADAGRAQPLTLEQAVEQLALVELENGGGAGRQLGQQRLLAGRLHLGQNGVWPG